MRHLVYCILRARPRWRGQLPAGVAGAAVSLVTAAELAAAVSRVSEKGVGNLLCAAPAGPSRQKAPAPFFRRVAHATAHADVIAALSADRTVLPIRYGCLLSSSAQVRELLRTRRAEFAALLDELDGCVEMGVRVLLPGPGRPVTKRQSQRTKPGSGTAYLAGRSAAYARRDAGHESVAATVAALRRTFDRLSVQSRASGADVGDKLLVSLYFLIRREHVSAFRREFRRLQAQYTQSLLLSGPWAPYNFVPSQAPEAMR